MSVFATASLLLITAAGPQAPLVSDIVIQTDRTKHEVIRRELLTRPGEPFSGALWQADLQRLKNMGVFWSVDATAVTQPEGTQLHLNIRDKWTLLPRLRFTTAADVLAWQVGLYDANVLGYYTEIGAQVEQKAGAYGFLFWHYNWSVRNTDYYYKVEAGKRQLFRYVYSQALPGDAVDGIYESGDYNAMVEFGKRINDSSDHLIGLIVHPGSVQYRPSTATLSHTQINEASGFQAPAPRRYVRTGFHVQWGRPQQDDYIFSGGGFDAYVLTRLSGGDFDEASASLEYVWFTSLFNRHNAGVRLFAGRSSSSRVEDALTMGGLNEIRGFPDERFYGQNIWFVNTEYRIPLMDNRWFLVQPAAFADAGKAWNGSLIDGDAVSGLALSGGAGLRLRLKPSFNTALRIDYGWAFRPFRDSALSLGITQFF